MNDVNEYAPVFKEKSYKATVIEGKRYDNILKVEAVDADCSPQFSQICNYEIVTPDVPFAIDKDGKNMMRDGVGITIIFCAKNGASRWSA